MVAALFCWSGGSVAEIAAADGPTSWLDSKRVVVVGRIAASVATNGGVVVVLGGVVLAVAVAVAVVVVVVVVRVRELVRRRVLAIVLAFPVPVLPAPSPSPSPPSPREHRIIIHYRARQ